MRIFVNLRTLILHKCRIFLKLANPWVRAIFGRGLLDDGFSYFFSSSYFLYINLRIECDPWVGSF